MKELTIEEHKKLALDILIDVADFCEKNGIRYFLAYGTLIGAIRHKGYIPWDDDIDIMIPRPDYDKFLKLYSDKSGRYKAVSPADKNAKLAYAKVIDTKTVKIEGGVKYSDENDCSGVDIDVFPLEGQPTDEKDFIGYMKKRRFLIRELYAKTNRIWYGSLKRRLGMLAFLFVKLKNKDKIIEEINATNYLYDFDKAEFVGITGGMEDAIEKNRYKKAWFDKTTEVDFEGYRFKAPSDYDAVLRRLYGDYMKLPPENERITHHSNKIYLK